MQTFGIFLTLGALGGKRGFFTVITYVLLGFAGFPIFSGFKGGVMSLLDMGGGFIIGFILASICYWIMEKIMGNSKKIYIISCIIGILVCYISQVVWYIIVYLKCDIHNGILPILVVCVLPFVIPDTLKILLAVLLRDRICKIILKEKPIK